MSSRKQTKLPTRLERTRERFERWRRASKVRRRIPESLWSSAAKMARVYGVNRAARALRLDYYSLKERMEEASPSGEASQEGTTAAFLELGSPTAASSCECVLELEDDTGARMRVQVKGVDAPDLAALSRSFRGVD